MNVVICRNVLIYFDKILQDKVFKLFSNSLIHNGFLCIGTKEAIDFSAIEGEFSVIAKLEKIYRKK
jgi:chemotaxis protein methyltransferase CheR